MYQPDGFAPLRGSAIAHAQTHTTIPDGGNFQIAQLSCFHSGIRHFLWCIAICKGKYSSRALDREEEKS
jgi:hypothetical protein